MSGVKHTRGPWEVDDSGCVHVMGDEWNFIPLISPFRGGAFKGDKEAIANARLIAAAPCMFDYILSSAQNGCATAQEIVERATGDRHEKGEQQ